MKSKTFVQTFYVQKTPAFFKHFWCKTKICFIGSKAKLLFEHFGCKAKLWTNILGAKQNISSNNFCANWNICLNIYKIFVLTFLCKSRLLFKHFDAKQDFCSVIMGAKQDFCSNDCVLKLKQDFCLIIWSAEQHFCLNILSAKQSFAQVLVVNSLCKTFVESFGEQIKDLVQTFWVQNKTFDQIFGYKARLLL